MLKSKTLICFFALPVTIILCSFCVFAGDDDKEKKESIKWYSIEEVEELRKKEPRKIFIDVYTSWCGWCKVMDKRTFSDREVAAYVNDNYYAIKLNAEGKEKIRFRGQTVTEAEFALALNATSYPTIVLIDETFQYINPIPGYRKADQFKEILVWFNEEELQEK